MNELPQVPSLNQQKINKQNQERGQNQQKDEIKKDKSITKKSKHVHLNYPY